jgi:iron complex transport system ATP-binding protein
VEEIVAMGAGDRPRAVAQPLVDAAIAELQLEPFRHRELPTLSGGEQQRAHFARVLVQLACGEADFGPGVLLLDEPTSSLDLRYQINLVETARRRARSGTAVVAVLHDLNLAVRFADRIIVLRRGQIVTDGTPTDTITDRMIADVFDVETSIGTESGQPYVLLQNMR